MGDAGDRGIGMGRPRGEPIAAGLAGVDEDVGVEELCFNRVPAMGGLA